MRRKLEIGALAAALLMSGLLVGVSYGGGGGITDPTVIELSHSNCGKDAHCWFHALRSDEGSGIGQLTQARLSQHDVDGDVVGMSHAWLTFAKGTGWMFTGVETLRNGPHTSHGSITLTGFVPRHGCYFGGDPCTFAVTGGTGAYLNVRGYATVAPDPKGFRTTLYLIP